VILLNSRDEVLLLRGSDPHLPEAGTWWLTPGGGCNDGETLAQTARRELFEETGARVDDLGSVIFSRSAAFDFNGNHYEQDEWYFIGRIDNLEPSFAGFETHEIASIDAWRWWTRDELRTTNETVYPAELVQLLDDNTP
jgi:8-oxo-dGTP pyrophosphatase MutT (NUDIX family)